ncbi:uncharacterized protein [Procambarus clarkii]|uniref:uncharacterized protein n=1 Tax=Procambarus clarkii TaxID=6728 RepID=UPI0037438E04
MLIQKGLKSLIPGVATVDTMDAIVGHALSYQKMFERKTSPWEMELWREGELENFIVDLKKVDRLYHIYNCDDDVTGSEYELLVRMEHNDQHVFVELIAGCDFTGFDCDGGGEIYVSFNANLFFKTVGTRYDEDLIYQSLIEDEYRVEGRTPYDRCSVASWHNAPTLKFLCHLTVSDNKHQLRHYPDVLPKVLTDSLNEFIGIKDAIEDYDNWD